jgi:MoaA/NifB/PqqE/SkfB family radical SAM enzyme
MVTILLTTKCNFKCSHCLFSCTSKGKHITDETLYNLPNYIEKSGGVNIVGGEPFLNPNAFDIIKNLGDIDCYNYFRVVSNGSFIYNKRKTEKVVDTFNYLLNQNHETVELTISNDIYHEVFWKNQYHLNFIKDAFDYISCDNFYLNIEKRKSENVISLGRAKKINNNIYCSMDNKSASCTNITYERDNKSEEGIDDELPLFDDITIFPNGDIFPCCQAVKAIGNINIDSISTIENKLKYFYENMKSDLLYGNCKNCATIHKNIYNTLKII